MSNARSQLSSVVSVSLVAAWSACSSSPSSSTGTDAGVEATTPVIDATVLLPRDGTVVAATCGDLVEGGGRCSEGLSLQVCEGGQLVGYECGQGTVCGEDSASELGFSCFCDDAADDFCANPVCMDDPDCGALERLVPEGMGRVDDFVVNDHGLYVLTRSGRGTLRACALSGCVAEDTQLDVNLPASTTNIESNNNGVFWIHDSETLKQVDFAGTITNVFSGAVVAPIRAAGDDLFFGTPGMNHDTYIQWRDGLGGFHLMAHLTELDEPVLGAGESSLLMWQGSSPVAPQPISLRRLPGAEPTVISTASGISREGLLLVNSNVFWIGSAESGGLGANSLMGCPSVACAEPAVIATNVGPSITTDGTKLLFSRVQDTTGNVLSCDIAAAAIGTCEPALESSALQWVAARHLHANADWIYATDQASSSVWRARRR